MELVESMDLTETETEAALEPSELSRSDSESSMDSTSSHGGHHHHNPSADGSPKYRMEAKVMYAFQSTEETEMSVEVDDLVRMLEEAGDDGWAFAELVSRGGVAFGAATGNETRGYIPFAYVQLIAPRAAAASKEGGGAAAAGGGASGDAAVTDALHAQMRQTHYSRERVRQVIEYLPLRIGIIALVVLDLVVLAIELILSIPGVIQHADTMFAVSILADVFTLIVTVLVGLEVGARIFVHQKYFFTPLSSSVVWVNLIDLGVAILSAVIVPISITFTVLIYATEGASGAAAGTVTTILRLLLILRLVRLVRIVVFACTQRVALTKATRRLVSQNRRRFRDPEFDLDLTYVTDQIIAMSLPARGQSAAIRNPIGEVARFFRTRHEGHYHVLNLTSESYGSYVASAFEEHVTRLPVDDHNAVPLLQLYNACCSFEKFFGDPKNILAAHCKGGKGRTGMYICCLLLHMRKFVTAAEALDYFAERRSDLTVSNKYQGVQTPSQARYVQYYAAMIAAMQGAAGGASAAAGAAAAVVAGAPRAPLARGLHMPPKMQLQAIRIFGLPLGIDTLQISAQVRTYRCELNPPSLPFLFLLLCLTAPRFAPPPPLLLRLLHAPTTTAGEDELGADLEGGSGLVAASADGAAAGEVKSGGLFTALPKEIPEYLFDLHQLSSDVDKGAKLVFINRSIETLACAEFGDLAIPLQGDVKVRVATLNHLSLSLSLLSSRCSCCVVHAPDTF